MVKDLKVRVINLGPVEAGGVKHWRSPQPLNPINPKSLNPLNPLNPRGFKDPETLS